MQRTLLSLSFAGLALASSAFAQIDDAMWVAARQGRSLTKVSPSGEVLQTVDLSGNGTDLSTVARAPNGNLWIVNFITTRMTIVDRNGGNLVNVDTTPIDPTRGATDIVFDRTGVAWVTFNSVATVARYTPAGTLINTITVPGAPLGITIDRGGFVWVGHRMNAPSMITRIDPTNFTTTSFTLPANSRTLGGNVYADSPGVTGNSRIWTSGDSANELHAFDDQGTHLGMITLGGNANAGINSITQDGAGNIWAMAFRSSTSLGEVHKVDRNTMTVLGTISDSPEPIGLGTDAFGRVWYTNRISFSGPQPTELRRADPAAVTSFEVTTPVGVGAYKLTDPNGFHYANVVNPFGDADADGSANIGEVLNGTSMHDPQSNTRVHLLSGGRTSIGSSARIDAKGSTAAFVVAFATGARVDLPVPGFTGNLRLDPTALLPIVLPMTLPGTLPIAIPNDPTLIGLVLRAQGLGVGPGAEFSNDTAILVQ